tara:strand:+ start:34 stop:546 length:513 start_codon:yes stop_codon:yes gene_type:complete
MVPKGRYCVSCTSKGTSSFQLILDPASLRQLNRVTTSMSSVFGKSADINSVTVTETLFIEAQYLGSVTEDHAGTMLHSYIFRGRLYVVIEYTTPGLSRKWAMYYAWRMGKILSCIAQDLTQTVGEVMSFVHNLEKREKEKVQRKSAKKKEKEEEKKSKRHLPFLHKKQKS